MLAIIVSSAWQKFHDFNKIALEFSVLCFQKIVFTDAPLFHLSSWIDAIVPALLTLFCGAPTVECSCYHRPGSSKCLQTQQIAILVLGPMSLVDSRLELIIPSNQTLLSISAIAHRHRNFGPLIAECLMMTPQHCIFLFAPRSSLRRFRIRFSQCHSTKI